MTKFNREKIKQICDIRGMKIFKFEVLGNNQTMHNMVKELLQIIQTQIKSPIKIHSQHKTPEEDLFHSRKEQNKRNKEKQNSTKASLTISHILCSL